MNITKDRGSNAGVGPKIGIGIRYSFNGKDVGFGVRSGLYYSQRKITTSAGGNLWGKIPGSDDLYACPISPGYDPSTGVSDDMTIESVSFDRYEGRKDFLQLPVMAQYAWKITPVVRFHIAAGPYFALGVGGKIKHYGTNWEIGSKELTIENDSRSPFFSSRFDMGVSAQTGLEIKRVAFLLNYESYLYKRIKGSRKNGIYIGLGYTF